MNNRDDVLMKQEREILTGMMLGKISPSHVFRSISAKDFKEPMHQRIVEAIAELESEGVSIDTVSVSDRDPSLLATVGEVTAYEYQTVGSFDAHLKAIKEASRKRQVYKLTSDIQQALVSGDASEEVIAQAQSELIELSKTGSRKSAVSMREALKDFIEDFERKYESGDEYAGIPTGLQDLDRVMGGMSGGEVIVIAGRPGQGKTTLATTILFNVAKQRKACMFFSLEMQYRELMARMVSSAGRMDMERSRRPSSAQDDDWPRLTKAGQELHDLPIYIDDEGGITVDRLCSKARSSAAENKLELIIVDYLQLFEARNPSDPDYVTVTHASKRLKQLAKELDVPVIVLAQLNREVEKRPSPRPVLSDLRDSGSIEQDADFVIFGYRPGSNDETAPDDTFEAVVAKNRHGETGDVRLKWIGKHNLICDYDPGSDYGVPPVRAA